MSRVTPTHSPLHSSLLFSTLTGKPWFSLPLSSGVSMRQRWVELDLLGLGKTTYCNVPGLQHAFHRETHIRDIHGTPHKICTPLSSTRCLSLFLVFLPIFFSLFFFTKLSIFFFPSFFFKRANMSVVIHVDSGLLSKYFHCNFNQEINGKSF